MFNLLKFLIFLLAFIYAPGRWAVSRFKVKLGKFEEVILSMGLGIVILTFLAFVLGWLKLRFFLFPVLFILGAYELRQKKRPIGFGFSGLNWGLFGLLLAATVFQSLVMIKSGLGYQGGIAFWGVHGHDGLWHVTLIQELARNFPGQNPGFAGAQIRNYHYFFDLFAAEIYRLTGIPILDLYFRYLPLFLSFLLNSLVFIFAHRWSGKKRIGYWAILLVSFTSSFGHLLPFLGIGSANWETAFWAMQPATALQNPPFFISLILLTAGLILFLFFEEKNYQSQPLFLALLLIFGSLVEFKAYGGLIVLSSLGFLAFWQFLVKRKTNLAKLSFFSFLIGLLVYLPSSKASTSFIKWQPFWFIRTMIQAGDRVNWVDLELRRQTYLAGGSWLAVLVIDALSLGLFLVGNLGIRVFGFISLTKKLLKPRMVDLLLILIFLIGLFPPLFFLQKHLVWNTIQFFYYSIFILSFFAALAVNCLFQKTKTSFLKLALIVTIILLSLPGSLKTISWHWGKVPTSVLDRHEKQALEFIKDNSQRKDQVLVYPYLPGVERKFLPPVPLSYYNAAYVSFFSGRHVFLEDQTAALIQGYGFEKRFTEAKKFFATTNASFCNQFLNESKIDFVYLVDDQVWQAHLENKLSLIFENKRARVYRVVN